MLLNVAIIFLALMYVLSAGVMLKGQLSASRYVDFSMYYFSAIALGRGVDLHNISALENVAGSMGYDIKLYDTPYINSPFHLVLFSPLTFFSLPTAFILWVLFSHVLLAGAVWLYYLASGRKGVGEFRAELLILLLFTVSLSYLMYCGQVTSVLLFLLLLFYYAVKKDSRVLAGVSLGVSTMIKPIALIFYPYLLFKKEFRVLFAALATMAALVVFTGMTAGWGVTAVFFYRTLVPSSFTSNILEYVLQISPGLIWLVRTVIMSVFILILYVLCGRAGGTEAKSRFELEYALILASTLVLLPRNAYYNYPLLIPVFWILYDRRRDFIVGRRTGYLTSFLLLLTVQPVIELSFYAVVCLWLLLLYLMFKRR